jgi:hypothetical protein
MKYVPPYGVSDPNASYVNGDPPEGVQGSIPPAAVFEEPQREIISAIVSNGFIPTDSDLTQLLQATRSQYANYCLDTGSINTLSVALNPPLVKYTLGLPLRVRVNQTNTSGATIDAGCGRVYVRRPDGSNVLPNDLPAGGITDLVFDGTGFQMVNYLGGQAAGDIINNYNNIPYCVDTSTTANVIIAPFSPAITSIKAGDLFLVRVANTTTQATTLQVNALAARPCKVMGSGDLLQGDITLGDIKLFTFDGTNFQVTPNLLINTSVTLNVPTAAYPTIPAALSAIMRKRISTAATVTIKVAAGTIAPFSINHPDADRIVVQGTMLAAQPGVNDMYRSGATYNNQVNDGWNNLNMIKARYGTLCYLGNGQLGCANIGPGNPTIQDIAFLGPFNAAQNPGNPGAWWDGSCAVLCQPGRMITCTNIMAWGMGWACYEGEGYLTCNSCYGTASINGASSRFATGFIRSTSCIWNSNFYTGINADEQSEWYGLYDYALCNQTGIQPLAQGFCHASSCNFAQNAAWDNQALLAAVTLADSCVWNTSTPPFNGGEGNGGSYSFAR